MPNPDVPSSVSAMRRIRFAMQLDLTVPMQSLTPPAKSRSVAGDDWCWEKRGSPHYGKNLIESTRCDVENFAGSHPIFRGVRRNFWVPDDVYGVSEKLEGDSEPVLLGQPLAGWSAEDEPVADKAPVPIAWTKFVHRICRKGGSYFYNDNWAR